ncbi:MAG: glycosyltransferase family 9 protein [Elusimicrobiales bacterium]|jgi:ADP-heptose:LPS heptosyltransferase|nr:glycosyltransferase family 9 protein [Elusimicrobiales bacterium]
MMNINLLKFLDKYAGLPLCLLLTVLTRLFRREAPALRGEEIRRTLAMKFFGMGSILLLAPTLAEFRKTYPGSRLVFLTLGRNREISRALGLFDDIVTLDIDGGWAAFAGSFASVMRYLWKERFDLVLDFEFFTRFSAIVSFFTFARVKVGYHAWETWRGNIHTIRVPFNRYWHISDSFYALGTHIGLVKKEKLEPVRPLISQADRDAVKGMLEAGGASGGYVCAYVSAGDLSVERRWPADSFARLLGGLIERGGPHVVLTGSGKETPYVREMHRRLNSPRALDFSGRLSVTQLAALLEGAKLVISNDGGPLHLAAAMGTRTVSFFGPETPVIYGPLGEGHSVFFKNIECSPCINVHDRKSVRCYWTEARCMQAIDPEEVLKEVEKKLAR